MVQGQTEVDPPSIFSQREDCQNQSSLQDQQEHDHQNAGEEQEEVITLEGTDGREPEIDGEEEIFQEDGRMNSKKKRGSVRGTITLGGLKKVEKARKRRVKQRLRKVA